MKLHYLLEFTLNKETCSSVSKIFLEIHLVFVQIQSCGSSVSRAFRLTQMILVNPNLLPISSMKSPKSLTSTTSLMCDKLFSHLWTLSKNGPTNLEAVMLCRFIELSSRICRISSTEPNIKPKEKQENIVGLSCKYFWYRWTEMYLPSFVLKSSTFVVVH